MDLEILNLIQEINSGTEKQVIVRWGGHSASNHTFEVKSECWEMTITNDPEKYFQSRDGQYKRLAKRHFKKELATIEYGVQLAKGLARHYKANDLNIEVAPEVDSGKKIYMAIHIHYHTT